MQGPMSFNLLLCSSIFLVLLGVEVVHCSSNHGPEKLFVFGDSYADTGNDRNPDQNSWKEPYGITYPGKPSGRFSDGRTFTDFLAKGLGLKTPMTYTLAKTLHKQLSCGKLKTGVNLAYGGTGVLDTIAPYPNMTTQIDIFQELVYQGVFSPRDLQHSVAHVSYIGTDYVNYILTGGALEGLPTLLTQVIDQLKVNLQRIVDMGITKITVTGLPPLGCVPAVRNNTAFPTPNQECNNIANQGSQLHNLLVQEAVSNLNNQTSATTLVYIDFYTAILSVIQPTTVVPHKKSKFDNLLSSCCDGINSDYSCGDVDANGNKMYTVCQDPKSYFFWDNGHPTQAGWTAVSKALEPTVLQVKNAF